MHRTPSGALYGLISFHPLNRSNSALFGSYSLRNTHPCVGRPEPCRVHMVWAMSPNRPKRRVHRVGRQEPCRVGQESKSL